MGKRFQLGFEKGAAGRKVFYLPGEYAGREVTLDFDGVSAPCSISFNGMVLRRQYVTGVPFTVDITDLVYFGGQKNILAVCPGMEETNAHIGQKVLQDASKCGELAGTDGDRNAQDFCTERTEGGELVDSLICGDVCLEIKEIVNLSKYGVFIKPEQTGPLDWNIHIETTVGNMYDRDVEVKIVTRFTDPDEEMELAVEAEDVDCEAESETTIAQDVEFHAPKIWDIEYPNVYSVVTELYVGERLVDTDETVCGFRTFSFDEKDGYELNGRKLKLYGAFGRKQFLKETDLLPPGMCEYTIAGLKDNGANAYWCVDGIAPEGILDACDKYGMLVIDGGRSLDTSQENMENMQTMVMRDRNHPSLCMYSLCTESVFADTDQGERMEKHLRRLVMEQDDSRPVMRERGQEGLQDIDIRQLPDAPFGGFMWVEEPYMMRVMANSEPFCYIKPHWNPSDKEGQTVQIDTYTNCQEAELFVNKKSYGRKDVGNDGVLTWEVEYEPGVLEMVGYRDRLKCVHDVKITTGEPTRIKIVPWRGKMYRDGRDTIPFDITLVDDNGYQVPDAEFTPEVHVNGGMLLRLEKTKEGYQAVIQSERGARQLMVAASAPGLSIGNVMIPLVKRRGFICVDDVQM